MGSLRLEISKTREGGGRPGVEGTGPWTCRWEENRGSEGKGTSREAPRDLCARECSSAASYTLQ